MSSKCLRASFVDCQSCGVVEKRWALTEVTSFLVELARGNKAAASTKVAAQAAAAVIKLRMAILKLLHAQDCKVDERSGWLETPDHVPYFILHL